MNWLHANDVSFPLNVITNPDHSAGQTHNEGLIFVTDSRVAPPAFPWSARALPPVTGWLLWSDQLVPPSEAYPLWATMLWLAAAVDR